MNHQNQMNYQPSSYNPYDYYNNYNNNNNININNPQIDQIPSAPPDPSYFYYSSPPDNNYPPNPSYDPNPIPSWYHNQVEPSNKTPPSIAVKFDDYGRPINHQIPENDNVTDHQSVYASSYSNGSDYNSSSNASKLKFDDYGRPISAKEPLDGDKKIVKATPLVVEDASNGVQKFRVVLLSEGAGLQGDMDVLCQIGLDGIRILDPATTRTLKVYTFDTVTRWEVLDSNVFAFWTKSSVDTNERRVRLKSNGYTTTNILDLVAAASIQFKEMDGLANSEQVAEKKKVFPDWKILMKPGNEEKDHWVPDEASVKCTSCSTYFGAFVRRHHCRNCGDIFCDKCTQGRIALTAEEQAPQVRVCDQCMAEVTQRLSHVDELASRSSGNNRHEDLAKKLQEMEKNRNTTAGLKFDAPDAQMKEVECPTCTVHLQVEVPAMGSKTIECSVCQHPFLVSAH
uniref:protein FREE1-like isoform X2 n=1 Tax=Erigeron canadensis TaxID=72917 RepID=UPI001CB9C20E|nr:protein FREE1-like isoform X2 [Erigeron canadensis]